MKAKYKLVKGFMTTYPNMVNDYYSDKKTDQDLMNITTQPFWYSMTLSKRRLESKGLVSEVEIEKDKKIREKKYYQNCSADFFRTFDDLNKGASEGFEAKNDNVHETGILMRKVLTKRTYKKNGRIIYSKKEHEYCKISALKSFVKDGKTACPNCGALAVVSTYIDGCDSCGSKFTVNEFEPKVSGFSLEDNNQDKIRTTLKSSYIKLVLVFLLGTIFAMVLNQLVFKEPKDIKFLFWNINPGQTVVIYTFVVVAVAVSFFCLILQLCCYFGITYSYIKKYGSVTENDDVVKNIFSDFSPIDFCQKLELKIKNIILANDSEEIKPFATVSLSNVLFKYKDVVDCNLVSFRFSQAEKKDNHYMITGVAKIRLFEYIDEKIVERYENIHITMQGKFGVVDQPITQLKEYKCPNCASSVDLIKGCTCDYCGSQFDYDDFDWIISRFEIGERPENFLSKAKKDLFLLYLIPYLIGMAGPVFVAISSHGQMDLVLDSEGKVIYVNEEHYKNYMTIENEDDIINILCEGYYTMEDCVDKSPHNQGDIDYVYTFECNNEAEIYDCVLNRLKDKSFKERDRKDGLVVYAGDVYINYSHYAGNVVIPEQLRNDGMFKIRVVLFFDE